MNVTLFGLYAPMLPALPALAPLAPYVLAALPFILGVVALIVNGRLREFALTAVGAAYKVAISAADELQGIGLDWLNSPEGKEARRELALRAYDALPGTIGPVPVGIVKLYLTRERFCELVEAVFNEVREVAARVDIPDELPLPRE